MKVKFSGGKEIEAALKALDVSVGRKRGIALRALQKAAVPIRDAWVDGADEQSGDLKRSIAIGSRAQTKATRKFRRTDGQDTVEQFIGIDAQVNERLPDYSVIEEFGSDRQPANPAGRSAWEAEKMNAFNLIGDAMRAEITKVAKARAKKVAKK